MSPNDPYPQHLVTVVIVAHDGAEWLPRVIDAVLAQTEPVHRIVAVDTGSRDRSGALLADLLGPEAVFGMDRDTGYAAAVGTALRHSAAMAPVSGRPGFAAGAGPARRGRDRAAGTVGWADPMGTGPPPGYGASIQPVEWVWLLHDDCAPDPGALAELLRGATEAPGVAVLGPKVLDWADRHVILEAGLAIDTAGRRVSGTEPREVDQGQHDGDRDVLAVSSAGMLARRDVWDEVGGFDPGLPLFREDIDFCWRVHAAGYRVRLITGAVVCHLEASARGRRQLSAVPRPRRADRRHALIVLLGNLPLTAMIAAAAGNAALSAARILFFLLGKRPEAARDEGSAVGFLLAHPGLLYAARRQRRLRGRRRAYGALRSQVPRGQSLRKLAEFAAATLYPSSRVEATGLHHASDDPSDDDSLLTDSGLAQRILTNPGVVLFATLTVIALVAERSLVGPGPLGGGALLPAWGGASGLWGEYLAGFHSVGIGSAASTPPYIAVIAAVSTILAGKPWLAVAVILLGCVPLSGMTAYLAARRFTSYTAVRAWLAASYALLPTATGAVAAGRLGTAAVFILMPLIVSAAGRMLTERGRRARRAAWATGLLIALAAAFVPLVWVMAVVIAAFAGPAFARTRQATAVNLAIVALVPPILLAPWTLVVAEHPSMLLLEAGVQSPRLASPSLPARSLLLLNPGGPGTPPTWVAAGLVLAALAALLLRRRGVVVAAAWGVALSGLLAAIAVSRFLVGSPAGGPPVPAWPGVALVVAAIGLLLAVASAGRDLHALFAARGLRRLVAVAMAVAACAPPVLAAGFWLVRGVSGPVSRVSGPLLPEFVSLSSAGGTRLRTLVLSSDGAVTDYTVLRDADPPLGSVELTEPPAAAAALQRLVAALAAPDGDQSGNLGASLAEFDIGYILMPAPVSQRLASQVAGVVGVRPVSDTSGFELWRVSGTVARVRVSEPDGTEAALPSGTVNVSGAAAPAAGGTLVLAEPASGAWHATLDGRPLAPLARPVNGWAQGFRLPPGGGRLDISRDQSGRAVVLALEAVVLVVAGALALPGARDAAAGTEEPGAAGRSRRGGGIGRGAESGAAGRGSQRASAGPGTRASPDLRADTDDRAGQDGYAGVAAAGGRRGLRGREQRPAGSRRGTRGGPGPGHRHRAGPDAAQRTGPDPAQRTGTDPATPNGTDPGARHGPHQLVGTARQAPHPGRAPASPPGWGEDLRSSPRGTSGTDWPPTGPMRPPAVPPGAGWPVEPRDDTAFGAGWPVDARDDGTSAAGWPPAGPAGWEADR